MGEDEHEVTVVLSGSDLVFLAAYSQIYRGEQADIDYSNVSRSPEDTKADRSAGIHDALQLLRQVTDWQQQRGDHDEWYARREARMQAAEDDSVP